MTGPKDVEVLLVEDTPGDSELTLRALQKHGFGDRVHHVEDGQQALDFLFAENAYSGRSIEKPPRVVLLDLSLPKVGGLEVLKRLKSDERTMMIPVVVMTSSDEERDIIGCYRLGVNSYITKPLEFERFLHAVSQFSLYWLEVNRPAR